jgi:methionyl-tRNA synthetase
MSVDISSWPTWAKNLAPGMDDEEKRILDCVVHHKCPECGGSKPEGEYCQDCGFYYGRDGWKKARKG